MVAHWLESGKTTPREAGRLAGCRLACSHRFRAALAWMAQKQKWLSRSLLLWWACPRAPFSQPGHPSQEGCAPARLAWPHPQWQELTYPQAVCLGCQAGGVLSATCGWEQSAEGLPYRLELVGPESVWQRQRLGGSGPSLHQLSRAQPKRQQPQGQREQEAHPWGRRSGC
eukprot:6491776-Amphidinium_carterae.3